MFSVREKRRRPTNDGKKESDQYLHMMLFNAQIAVNARGREKQEHVVERQHVYEREINKKLPAKIIIKSARGQQDTDYKRYDRRNHRTLFITSNTLSYTYTFIAPGQSCDFCDCILCDLGVTWIATCPEMRSPEAF